jgi:uncharacterized protein (TIGR02145 family)
VRAYATNSAGTAYGAQKTINTPCNTFAITISGNTSINSGESTTLTASGAYSYVWKSGSTTVGNTATVTLTPTSTTTYSVTGTDSYGCTATTSVTVTVTNNDGLPCPGQATVTDYDGNVYNTVLVGNQCWMKENLRTTHYANGTSVSYNNYSASNIPLEKRGYLYNWTAAMNGASSSNTTPSGVQGICPTGWHLPSIGEWIQLRNYVNSQNGYLCNSNTANNAKALAYTNYWNISSTVCHVGNNMEQNNTTGLSIVPAGIYNGQSFSNAGSIAYLQSSSSYGNTQQSYDLQILHNEFSVQTNSHTNRSYGQSVRCIRNN